MADPVKPVDEKQFESSLSKAMKAVDAGDERALHVVQAAALNTILQAKLANGRVCSLNADDVADAHSIVALVTQRLLGKAL